MFIKHIFLSNFRNFDILDLNADKINVIYGKNASGKTNLIEGIFTLLNGHSFNKRSIPLQKDTTKKTILSCSIKNNNNIYIEINKYGKIIKLNSRKTDILSLKKRFPSILYSIDSFLSFKNKSYLFSLLDRNSFIENREIADSILQYKKLIRLKKEILSSQNMDIGMLKVINERLVTVMDEISNQRINSIKYINSEITGTLSNFTDKCIVIKYKKAEFNERLIKDEMYKKRLLTSLNRDKIEILFDNKNIFTYSSTGEKKLVLLCIIMTIINHYNKYIKPVILIDDLEGDLDISFQKKALNILVNLPNQLFLTTLNEYLYNGANIIRL